MNSFFYHSTQGQMLTLQQSSATRFQHVGTRALEKLRNSKEYCWSLFKCLTRKTVGQMSDCEKVYIYIRQTAVHPGNFKQHGFYSFTRPQFCVAKFNSALQSLQHFVRRFGRSAAPLIPCMPSRTPVSMFVFGIIGFTGF